ncbi:MAG TPA: class II aldolase/adducin family protein [Fimbriimonadaceae bacterium]|nr:class II aldolase/adducin family protein [Fimbriimonadaceae bacterium]
MDELNLRREMCEVGRRLWERGLVGATEGNLSVRFGPDRTLCTPTGLSKGHMKPEDLIVIDGNGKPVGEGVPSSEIKLHVRILQRRPDCMAVVHAHPPIATAFSVAGVEIPDDLLPESIYVLGRVATVPFCMPGTDEVPDGLEPVMYDHKTFILSHHGAATMGKDLWDAYNRMETLERVAKVILVARLLGRPMPLPEEALRQMASALTGSL